MVAESFDNRFAVEGRYSVYQNASNALLFGSTFTRQLGWFGTIDSIGHPYPYRSGGPFALSRTLVNEGLATGVLNPYIADGYRQVLDRYLVCGCTANGIAATLRGSTTANDVLARSNPSRASVDLPYFFAELRELPELIMHIGKNNLRNAARANLTSEFGWETLVSDLKSLLDFQGAVNRRVSYLSNAFKRGGIRVQAELRKGSYRDAAVTVNGSSPIDKITTVKYGGAREWCSVSWVPVEDLSNGIPTMSDIRNRAFLSVIGASGSAHLVWNLLPWTWLIDWFAHVGSFLQARQNSVGFIPGQAYIMTHNVYGTDHYISTVPTFKGTIEVPNYVREVKQRIPSDASGLSASMPILTGEQIGILGSLAVLKLL